MLAQDTRMSGGCTVSGWDVMPPDLAPRPAGCSGDGWDVLADDDQSPDAVVMFDVRTQGSGSSGETVRVAVSRLADLAGLPDEELCSGCRGTGIAVDRDGLMTGRVGTLFACCCMIA